MADAAADHIARVRSLVHRLDDLEARRAKLDAEIAQITNELSNLTTGAQRAPIGLSTADAVFDVAAEVEANEASLWAGTKADQALAAIQKNPKMTYAELAVALYGDDTEVSKNKARSVMHFLTKKAKKLVRQEDGTWSRVISAEDLFDTSGGPA